jgi:hypothetical protein
MEEYQQRVDRLTSVRTAVISMEDSQTARDSNRNVTRLTWLATCFIPLSFVATFFSMQGDITQLQETYKWYFAAALPLSAIVLGVSVRSGFAVVPVATDGMVVGAQELVRRCARSRKLSTKETNIYWFVRCLGLPGAR